MLATLKVESLGAKKISWGGFILSPEGEGGREGVQGMLFWWCYVHSSIYYSLKHPDLPPPHTPGPKQTLEHAPLVAHGGKKITLIYS